MKIKMLAIMARQPGVGGLVTTACAGLFFFLTASAWAAERQALHNLVPAVTAHLLPTGSLSGSNRLGLAIGLPLRNREALTNLLEQIYDPASPNFHHYLTSEQFTKMFGPTEQDYEAIVAFAKANGLTVSATHPNRVLLDVNGTVADIEKALHVNLRVYQHPKEARTFYAPDAEPSLDLAVPVLHISGLDNYALPRPRLKEIPTSKRENTTPNAGSGPYGNYMGNDFRAAYASGLSLTGSGQTVGLLQFDGYTASDITYYESNAALPSVTLSNVLLDGFNGTPTGDGGEVEVSLDIEMAISMAPGLSEVVVYEAGPLGLWHDILNRMATDNLARQLSCSWYLPGGGADPVAEQIFQQMAAQGQSFFCASGDSCAIYGLIDFPGDSPNITIVGGTTLTTSGPGGAWVSETVWNWGNGDGSGGGISTSYAIPSWQAGINMTANHGSTTMRNTPDVAWTADNVYVRADGVDHIGVGGTSCAAPLWAGFMALVNQQAAANGRPPLGFINPAIYALGQEAGYTLGLHDITTGSNAPPFSSSGMFMAVPGYDLCTGWGTPNGSNLVNALVAPADALQISPGLGFAASGPPGGPFSPTAQSYSLKNTGTGVLNWTLANIPAWLNVTASSGQLKPAGLATLTVSLNSAASNLLVGTYAATLWFTNLNDGVGQSRQFILQVAYAPVVITRQPTNQAVFAGGTAAFGVCATGTGLHYYWRKNGGSLTDGGHISGSTTGTLTVSSAAVADAGVYSVIVSNFLGAVSSSGADLTVYSIGGGQVIQNGGFETGDFSGWTQSGNTNLTAVTTNAIAVHSGNYGAQFGPGGSLGFLSQTVPTVPGAAYVISAWLDSLDGAAPNEFLVEWNGSVLFDAANLGALGWTNLQFAVTATSASTVLEFGFRDDPAYLALDDVTVTAFTNVASPPCIVSQPVSQTVPPGGSATFSVAAIGSTPLNYCWLCNGSPIVGATQSSYTITSAQTDAGCQFSCLVTNAYGAVISSIALLTVAGPLHSFIGPDGGLPYAALVQGADGSFYGTTEYGGAYGYGNVFKMTTNGTSTLVSFNYSNGANPEAGLVKGSDGNFYGTTEFGGTSGYGTVFKITASGTLTILASFSYSTNGGNPCAALVQGTDGNFYGTASSGGTNGSYGTLFRMTTNGTLTALVSFNSTNGAKPYGGLVQGADGSFYGTTYGGGANGDGTVFRMTTNGTLTTLVSFNSSNGRYPYGGLALGADGNFYGTTESGGVKNDGTLFRITTNGTLTTLVSFNSSNGSSPYGGLVQGADGNLYGTTASGGGFNAGTIFRLASDGTLATLFSFAGTNGAAPKAALVQGNDGNFYGTTAYGGVGYNGYFSSGDGTVFCLLLAPTGSPPAIIAQPIGRIIPAGGTVTFSAPAASSAPLSYFWRRNGAPIAGATKSSYTTNNVQLADSGSQFSCLVTNAMGSALSSNAVLTVLPINASGPVFTFSGFDGGCSYAGPVQGANGSFYGTTAYGGTYGYGTVFRITTNGALTTLASFNSTNGANPEAGLVQGADGSFYGTTYSGGANGYGTVFRITTNGALTTLASFSYFVNGGHPVAALVQGTDGNFYGTASSGGTNGSYGTIFRMTTNGTLTALVSFNSTNGSYPYGGLVQGADGYFYGTTEAGGASGYGTVFSITTNGTLTTLVSFINYTNGSYPYGGLVQGADGNFYGTTYSGSTNGSYGDGTVFKMTTNGALTTLVSFNYATGANPQAGLMQGGDGNFYGTTSSGGKNGMGTVFRMSSDGTSLTNLYSFAGTNGRAPRSVLVQGNDGNFYGTAEYGGIGYDNNTSSGNGTVFRFAVISTAGPPAIITQPVNQTVGVGDTACFSVSASGNAPLSYFWRRNGAPIAGATQSSYSTNNVQLTDSGSQFSCLVSNALGTALSSTGMLTVVALPADYFTELFGAAITNLAFQTFTFTPDGSVNCYEVCRQNAVAFPTDPTGGAALSLGDDSYSQITLSGGSTVAIYNTRTNVLYVGSNGYLTMDSGDTACSPSFTSHFALPRVSALYQDLNPGAGGMVTWKQLSDRVAVTWLAVPIYGSSTQTNSFQVEMFFDGRIRLTYLNLNTPGGLVGLSAGMGQQTNFVPSDFTAYGTCESVPVLGTPAFFSGGAFQFTMSGSAGLTYDVQASTNLVDWITLTNFVSTNSLMSFCDPAASNFNHRFYRAVVP